MWWLNIYEYNAFPYHLVKTDTPRSGGSSRSSNDDRNKAFSKKIDFGEYSTKIDGKVTLVEKQNIDDWLIESFKDSNYRTVITNEPLYLYRSFGGKAKSGGAFATTETAGNRINAKLDSALLPNWKNTRQYEALIEVPKGTKLNIGRVEKQKTKAGTVLQGDGDQVLLPYGWPEEWVKEVYDIPSK